MTRAPPILKAVATVVWLGCLAWIATWSDTDLAVVCAAAGTVAYGYLVASWWAAGVPVFAGFWLALLFGLIGVDEADHGSSWLWAAYFFLIAAVLGALVAAGVAVRLLGNRP